jgi:multiple sugar transport system permease protein
VKTKLLYTLALVACVLTILPPLWALFVSLSMNTDAGAGFGLENYRDVLSQGQFWGSLWNSFLTASLSTAISIVLGCMAAFGMTRLGGEFNRVALAIGRQGIHR